ncbi:collagenase [Solihabitans fulvus]|uniref:microbial collagenase n=1 Tax=Solihabitans fulvus TaxID=1892852 RepID=A0A5B2XES7_9PSEU|nr:M9 family metallopeptidase [Solihabitans fulvus]KAA2261569.1 collagenase [Solihabitans fulvus]
MRHRSALPRSLAAGLAACLTTVGLLASPAFAAPVPNAAAQVAASVSPTTKATRPLGSTSTTSDQATAQRGQLDAAHQRPLSPVESQNPSKVAADRKTASLAAAQSCTAADFGSRSGSALVTYVESSTMNCVNSLFTLTGTDARNVFQEAQMVTVANAFHSVSATYPGDNSSNVWQLVLFLRAGYYVQSYHAADVGSYGQALASATEAGLDTFVASPHFLDVSSANGDVLGEVLILTDSANEQARYLNTYKQVLNAYNSSYDAYWSMDSAVNSVFTPIFRGHWNPAYITAVTADPSIIDTLSTFALNHQAKLNDTWFYLDSNAGSETARFLDTPALQAKVRPLAKGLLGASAITGTTAPLWVGVAAMTDAYDKAECSSYGTCDFTAKLTAAALPITYNCDAGHTFRAQSLTNAALATACTSLQGQDAYFHGIVKDNGPVANDHNTNIQIVTFASPKDYQTYSGWIFGNSTNNGGEYLEGDPSAAGNQARFLSYVKSVNDGFPADIWNLNHEYTHYLDGRYDTYGDFEAGQSVPDIWWIEGFAEYISYSYRGVPDTEALDDAPNHTYSLSTLWQSTYANSDQTRTYPWGYLSVRYMIERHPADVQAMLAKFRTGDYTGGYAVYNTGIGTKYDADFNSWLDGLAGGGSTLPACTATDSRVMDQGCSRTNQSATAGNLDYLYIYLPAGSVTLKVTTSGGTGNADLYYNPTSWATNSAYTAKSTSAGNDESITVTNTTAGYRYISLYATTAFSGVTVSTQY